MATPTTRRKFLGLTTSAAASTWAGASLFAAGASAAPGPNDTINLGIIGCGHRSRELLPCFSAPGSRVVAVCDVNSKRLAEVRELAGGERVRAYHDYRQLLASKDVDAVLIATPEYNSSISAALKNAIDWASRSPNAPLNGKPVAIMGASTGNFGTLRAQLHLRQILTHVGALPLSKPEVLVARAGQVFNADGRLVDEAARGFLRDLLVGLADWTERVSPAVRVYA